MEHVPRDLPSGEMPDLSSPGCYPHPVAAVRVMETHISRVYLTGKFAYKLKKRVALGFLDFTTLEARRRCCEEEVRLNRRLARELYLDVVAISGTPHDARIGGGGPVIDYAVRMREFPQEDLASAMLARGELDAVAIETFARRIAQFHRTAASNAAEYGTPGQVQASAQQNFSQIRAGLARHRDRVLLDRLASWTEDAFARVSRIIEARRAAGFVREVHGDLHLGNIVRLAGELVPFDCIEFSPALRWNDVMSETAFLVMDLLDRGAPRLADLFLDAYLAESGDYAGLEVLPFFVVYRALVRAKIHLLRAGQLDPRGEASPEGPMDARQAEHERLLAEYRRYAALASSLTRRRKPFLLLMHGLAASGKSTVARELLQSWHAIRLRSDVERKRLAGLAPEAPSASPVGGGLYSADRSEATYARLAELAATVLRAGCPVVVDATFIRRSHRERLAEIATALQVRWAIVDVRTPLEVMRERLVARAARGGDPSEATIAVLDRQLEMRQPLTAGEARHAIAVDGCAGLDDAGYARLEHRLRARADRTVADVRPKR